MAFLKGVSVLLLVAALMSAAAQAQDLHGSHIDSLKTRASATRPVDPAPLSRLNLRRAAARMRAERLNTTAAQPTIPPRKHVMGLAIAIGIGAGVAGAGVAASKYGENESGAFCTRCFTEWSAVSIPVGAGVGAAVGYLIDRARR